MRNLSTISQQSSGGARSLRQKKGVTADAIIADAFAETGRCGASDIIAAFHESLVSVLLFRRRL